MYTVSAIFIDEEGPFSGYSKNFLIYLLLGMLEPLHQSAAKSYTAKLSMTQPALIHTHNRQMGIFVCFPSYWTCIRIPLRAQQHGPKLWPRAQHEPKLYPRAQHGPKLWPWAQHGKNYGQECSMDPNYGQGPSMDPNYDLGPSMDSNYGLVSSVDSNYLMYHQQTCIYAGRLCHKASVTWSSIALGHCRYTP